MEWQIDEYGRPFQPGVVHLLISLSGPIIPPLLDPRRSSKWPKFLHEFLRTNPHCAGCGRKAETGHHNKPFHLFSELELVESNIVPICIPCHFVICHGGNWRLYVGDVWEALAGHKLIVEAAK